jgi:MGS-like domain/KAP family P-loop domain
MALSLPVESLELRNERIAQNQALEAFLHGLSRAADGGFTAAINTYEHPSDFGERFKSHLSELVVEHVEKAQATTAAAHSKSSQMRKSTRPRVSPVSGSARTQTPEEIARAQQRTSEQHLLSGDATLADLFASALGRAMNEADDRAFRTGAALAKERKGQFNSFGVLAGYLLTAPLPGTKSETAITRIIWRQYVQAHGETTAIDRVDFWQILGLSALQEKVEILASTVGGTDGIKISHQLGAMLLRSIQFAREAGRPQPFSTRHLLVCLLGESSQSIDDSALGLLQLLDVDVRKVRRMFRDWLATNRRDNAEILDAELGVTARASQGTWLPEWKPARIDSAKESDRDTHEERPLPLNGNVFISVADVDKAGIGEIGRQLANIGFDLFATTGTAAALRAEGLKVNKVYKVREGRPNVLDLVTNGGFALVINTLSSENPYEDEIRIRKAISHASIPLMTSLKAARAGVRAIVALKASDLEAADKTNKSVQDQQEASNRQLIRILGITGFSSEHTSLGARGGVTDELDINNFVTLFAELIAARETVLPLSMGLFAEWGAGKSHFMRMLEQKIDDLANETKADWAKRLDQEINLAPLAEDGEGPWCRRVVPIRFNAWHYRDTDLWASLVTEIFDRMFEFLAGPQKTADDRLKAAEKLMKQVKKARGMVAEAAAEAKAAEEAAQRAKIQARKEANRIQQLVREREKQQAIISGMLDNFELLLPKDVRTGAWEEALQILRLKRETGFAEPKKSAKEQRSSLVEIERCVSQFKSLSGRVRVLWLSVVAEDGRSQRLLYLAGAMIAAPILAGFVVAGLTFWNQGIQQAGMLIGSLLGFIGTTGAWLGRQMHRADTILTSAETMVETAQARRVDLERTPEIKRMRAELAKLDKKEEEAVERLRDAKAKVRRLEEELQEMRPERRLFRFIEERAAAKDYRQHLGLISLVRRDFQELSRLFTEKKDGTTVWESLLGNVEKSIDCIVLYVDDLDRCQSQRVVEVLEAVHLLLDFPLFVAVVAVDPRWVKQCLRAHYSKLLDGAEAEPSERRPRSSDVTPVDNGEAHANPLDYLEKIFHIPFYLPAMKIGGFKKLIIKLAGQTETDKRRLDQDATVAESETALHASEDKPAEIDKPVSPSGDTDITVGISTSPPRETTLAKSEHSFPPISGETRVLGIVKLERWEVERLGDYSSLISTPRAAKRFLNTYRLVRAGLPTADWATFCGDRDKSGEFRITMLLLAAAAGSPGLAREWFRALGTADPTALFLSDDDEQSKRPEWKQFKRVYDATFAETNLNLSKELFSKWLDRVERFAF